MIPMDPAATDMVEALPAIVTEMMGFVAMPAMVAAAIPEEAVIAPIAVVERPVIAASSNRDLRMLVSPGRPFPGPNAPILAWVRKGFSFPNE